MSSKPHPENLPPTDGGAVDEKLKSDDVNINDQAEPHIEHPGRNDIGSKHDLKREGNSTTKEHLQDGSLVNQLEVAEQGVEGTKNQLVPKIKVVEQGGAQPVEGPENQLVPKVKVVQHQVVVDSEKDDVIESDDEESKQKVMATEKEPVSEEQFVDDEVEIESENGEDDEVQYIWVYRTLMVFRAQCLRFVPSGWTIILTVALLIPALLPLILLQSTLCSLLGPSGLICSIHRKGCVLPGWICTDMSSTLEKLNHRKQLSTSVVLSSKSDAVTRFVSSTVRYMSESGLDSKMGYAEVFQAMENTRKQGREVSRLSNELIDEIPRTASTIETELRSVIIRASALKEYAYEEPKEFQPFLENLSRSLVKVIGLVDDEISSWEALRRETTLFHSYGKDLLSELSFYLGSGEMGKMMRAQRVLAAMEVTDDMRSLGVVKNIGYAASAVYAAGLAVPFLMPFAFPLGAALGTHMAARSLQASRSQDVDYKNTKLAIDHVETMFELMHKSLPGHLDVVDKNIQALKYTVSHLEAVRTAVGEANQDSLDAMHRTKLSKVAMQGFIGFVEKGIKQMETAKKLGLMSQKELRDHLGAA